MVQIDILMNMRNQSQVEEITNSISHGLGLIAAIVGTPFIIMHASRQGSTAFVVGTIVFSLTIIFLYLSSTLYHALPISKAKRVFQIVEHCAIFAVIAGTYTPFMLGILNGAWGWSLLGVIWGLAIAGVMLKVFAKLFHPVLSTGLYLLMGWVIIIAIDPLLERGLAAGFFWLLGGGLSYTAGVIFFVLDSRMRYGHLIWHLFVIGGSVCHYFAVFWYGA